MAVFCYNKIMKKEEILSKFNNSNDEEKQAILLSLLLEINKKEDTINNQKNNIDHLEDLVAYYKNLIFGKKSEKIKVDPGQLSLFDELEVEETIDELENKIQEINGYKRRPKGSKNLVNDDNNFPVEVILTLLQLSQNLHVIGLIIPTFPLAFLYLKYTAGDDLSTFSISSKPLIFSII